MNLLDLVIVAKLQDNATKEVEQLGDRVKGAASSFLGGAGLAFGAAQAGAAVAGFAQDVVTTGANFDTAMSQVAATGGMTMEELAENVGTVSTAYGDFEGNLRDFAQFMGRNTAFSASQAAEGLNYMALAGYDAQTSMDMLPNVLNLAAAGTLGLGEASDMLTDVQSALGLSLDETGTLVDQMAAAAANSNTSVGQLGAAMLQVGGTAKDMSGGTTEIATALGIMANNGIKGAEGGTALRNILLSLTPKSDDAAAAMEDLGLEFYDMDGNIRPLNESFNDLSVAMAGMSTRKKTEMLSAMFNKVDLKAVSALMANTTDALGQVEFALIGVASQSDDYEKFWTDLDDAMDASGVSFEEFRQNIIDTLDEQGMVTEETRQALLDMGVSAEQADLIMSSLSDTVVASETGWDHLEGAIAGAWYTTTSLKEELGDVGLDMDAMQAGFEGMGVSADEFTAALQYCNGDAQAFAEQLAASADEGVTLDDVVNAMGGDLGTVQAAFDETTASAQLMADTQLDNLNGDVTLLGSAMEGLMIAISDGVSPVLREFAQGGGELVSGLTALISGDQASADAAFQALGERISGAWESITAGLTEALPGITQFFLDLPGNIGIWVGDLGRTLVEQGGALIGGLLSGASGGEGGESPLVSFFTDLPTNVQTWIGDTAETLQQKGREFMAGLLFGTTEVSDEELKAKIEGLPGEVMAWIGNTAETLQQAGRNLIAGMLFGTTEVSDADLKAKIEGLPGEAVVWLQGVGETLQQRGRELVAGLLFGTTEVSDGELATAMSELPGKVLGFIGDTASTLFDTGVDFLTGFYVGVSDLMNGQLKTDMSNFLGTVGGFIGSAISSLWQVGVDFVKGFFTGATDERDGSGESTFGNLLELAKALITAGIDVATFLGEIGTSLISGFMDGVTGGKWTEMKEWFAGLPDDAVKSIGDLGQTLLDTGKGLIGGMLEGIKAVFGIDLSQPDSVSKFLAGIPAAVVGFIGDLGKTLLDTGKGLIGGLFDGIKDIFGGTGIEGDTVTKFLQDAPQAIVDAIGDLSQTLWQAGADLMNGLGAGIQAFIQDPIGTIAQLGEDVAKQFMETTDENSPSKVFEQLGGYLMEGLDNGINEESDTPTTSIETVAGELPNGFVEAYWSMHDQGAALMQSFGTGLSNAFYGGYGTGSVLNTLSTIGGSIASNFGGGYYTLYGAGQQIALGLNDGIVNVWNNVIVPNLQNITRSIPDWKGPLDEDKRLLVENGEAIMQGLVDGIDTGAAALYDTLGGITSDIPGAAGYGTAQAAAERPSVTINFDGARLSFRDRDDMEEFAEMLGDYMAGYEMGAVA